jgi:putative endonuclease
MPKKGYTYITTNKNNTVLYTGVTSTLKDRIDRHRNKKYRNAFSGRYSVFKLVWYQEFDWIGDALKREKQIKAGSRQKKIDLINEMNPEWEDLYDVLKGR